MNKYLLRTIFAGVFTTMLLLMGCPSATMNTTDTPKTVAETPQFENEARKACEGREIGDVCREAVCQENGYIPRGTCQDTIIGKACMNYGHTAPMKVYCAPKETCVMESRGQAICRIPRE